MPHRNPNVMRVSEILEQRIQRRQYLAGTWLPTERLLSEEFQVDRTIVRAALSELQKQGLIIRRPGSRPYIAETAHGAEAASSRRRIVEARNVAIILPQHGRFPSSQAILRGFHETLRLREAPYRVTVFDNYSDQRPIEVDLQWQALTSMDEEDMGGVVLWQMGGEPDPLPVRNLRRKGIPIVFLDRYPALCDGDHVGIDNRYSAMEAVRHLIELGHTRIGYIMNSEDNSAVQQRKQGYLDALKLQGLLAAPELICSMQGQNGPQDAADYFLRLPHPPTAVFAVNDYCAYTLLAGLTREGVRVPEEMSVIGFDDIDQFSPRPGLLTTIRQPFERMGARAAELLLERMASAEKTPTAWRHILLPTQLMVRDTCRAYSKPIGNPKILDQN